jgi:hypothetical protein
MADTKQPSDDKQESNGDKYIDRILSDPIESFAVSTVLEYLERKGFDKALEGLKKDMKQV